MNPILFYGVPEGCSFGAIVALEWSGLPYQLCRIQMPAAFAAASRHTDVVLGSVNTAVLLTSSLTMALAARFARLDARRHQQRARKSHWKRRTSAEIRL